MKNKAFIEAFDRARLSDEARERILEAAEAETVRRSTSRGRWRPLRAAAAVLAAGVLAGTALAVSPELRDLLWGDFEPLVQEFEPNEENTQVYDGMEARLVSALTDGFILKLHVEFRDLEGDRLRQFGALIGESPLQLPRTAFIGATGPEGGTGSISSYGFEIQGGARVLGFDNETGVLTVEFTRWAFNPPEGLDTVLLSIPSGILGTEPIYQESSDDLPGPDGSGTMPTLPEGQDQDIRIMIPPSLEGNDLTTDPDEFVMRDPDGNGIFCRPGSDTDQWTETGWTLIAPLGTLPVRHARAGELEVFLSDIGMMVLGPAGTRLNEVRIAFADGKSAGEELYLDGRSGGLEDRVLRTVEFSAPIDAASAVSVTVGDTQLGFE